MILRPAVAMRQFVTPHVRIVDPEQIALALHNTGATPRAIAGRRSKFLPLDHAPAEALQLILQHHFLNQRHLWRVVILRRRHHHRHCQFLPRLTAPPYSGCLHPLQWASSCRATPGSSTRVMKHRPAARCVQPRMIFPAEGLRPRERQRRSTSASGNTVSIRSAHRTNCRGGFA
jgi:hypothetical protein